MSFLRRYYTQIMFLLIGLTAGFFFNRLPIQFEPKTNWVSLASFFLTIFLAVYLEFVVRPSFTNNRNEKDLLIDQLKDIRTELSKLNDAYIDMRNTVPLEPGLRSDILKRFRVVSNQIDLLKQTDELCTITKKTEVSDSVLKCYLAYKKSLTGYGFDKAEFCYETSKWKYHERGFRQAVKSIMHAIIIVNKK